VTVELIDEAAEDAEEVTVAWLTPLLRSASIRRAGDPLPFAIVTHIGGPESIDESTSDPIVSVHTLCDKSLGEDAALAQCKLTHRRMLHLGRHLDDITLTDGRIVNVDYLNVVESPIWVYYSDQILRKVGRYQLGLSFVAAS
jgi:hypothetical protein